MRSFILGVIVGAVGGAAAVGLWSAISWLHAFNATEPEPALIRDLPKTVDEIDTAFSIRVKTQFPVGSAENELIDELQREGFEPRWSYEGEQIAVLERGELVCRNEWRVFWRTDGKGAVTAIDAAYAAICL